MKKHMAILLIGISLLSFTGCEKTITRNFGGTETIYLEKGQKLVEITWKEDSLWYLTRPMTEEDEAETFTFQQDTNFGVFEGTVIIQEEK